MKNRLLLWLLIFFSVFTVLQQLKGGDDVEQSLNTNDLGMTTSKMEYKQGKEVLVTLKNNTEKPIQIPQEDCPDEPLHVKAYQNGEWVTVSAQDDVECTTEESILALNPGEKTKISYKDWSYRLFQNPGRYRIEASIQGNEKLFSSNEFTVVQRGWLSALWMKAIYKPILNTLVFLIEKIPTHSLGFAIILLTIGIRTLLLIPSQRAMRSQKKMQDIQGKIEELKKKHKDNQEKLALETVNLWKEHKVNPFGSCLLLLVQFPILIALYYVVWEGLHPDKATLLYPQVSSSFSFSQIQTNFLGILELTETNFFVLPLIVGALQYFQIHLAMARKKAKNAESEKEKKKKTDLTEKVESTQDLQSQMQMANNMMKYFMPAMIAFFTASLPAGVGLYWATSTSYGILQQFVVNKEKEKKSESKDPIVKVIEN